MASGLEHSGNCPGAHTTPSSSHPSTEKVPYPQAKTLTDRFNSIRSQTSSDLGSWRETAEQLFAEDFRVSSNSYLRLQGRDVSLPSFLPAKNSVGTLSVHLRSMGGWTYHLIADDYPLQVSEQEVSDSKAGTIDLIDKTLDFEDVRTVNLIVADAGVLVQVWEAKVREEVVRGIGILEVVKESGSETWQIAKWFTEFDNLSYRKGLKRGEE